MLNCGSNWAFQQNVLSYVYVFQTRANLAILYETLPAPVHDNVINICWRSRLLGRGRGQSRCLSTTDSTNPVSTVLFSPRYQPSCADQASDCSRRQSSDHVDCPIECLSLPLNTACATRSMSLSSIYCCFCLILLWNEMKRGNVVQRYVYVWHLYSLSRSVQFSLSLSRWLTYEPASRALHTQGAEGGGRERERVCVCVCACACTRARVRRHDIFITKSIFT